MKNSKSKVLKIVLFFSMILIVLIYLLILNFGYINHHDSLTPTGNVDIFDINCDCPKSEQKDDNKNINEVTIRQSEEEQYSKSMKSKSEPVLLSAESFSFFQSVCASSVFLL